MNDTDRSRSVGDEYREMLTDLSWVAAADAVQLRVALHALCWRCTRSTVDAFASDPAVARKVLIVIRGIRDELDARIEAAQQEGRGGIVPLLRRRAAAETIITTCDAAVQLQAISVPPATVAADGHLMRAIARHAEAIGRGDACEADLELWQVLDRAPAAS